MTIVVIGGGWAGLSAAVELVRHGKQVTLIEAAPYLGGRARSVSHKIGKLDNGQHILIGAYRRILNLLDNIGIEPKDVFHRSPLNINIRSRSLSTLKFSLPIFPSPWNLFFGISSATGMSWQEKFSIFKFALQLRNNRELDAPDQSVRHWLLQAGQSEKLISLFWAPICNAALNTPAHIASSLLFANVLRLALLGRREDSDLLLPIKDLSEILPVPVEKYLVRQGCRLLLRQRVTGIQIEKGKVSAVSTEHQVINASQVIIATAPKAALRLIQPHPQLNSLFKTISGINTLPIYTAYLQFPQSTSLNRAMQGLHGYTSEWLFDRGRLTGQKGLIASVISAADRYDSLDKDKILDSIVDDIAGLYPSWPQVLQSTLIREPQAAFTAHPGILNRLPEAKTAVNGLWLAGDYTRTHLPATLESAVASGIRCANEISNYNGYNINQP